MNLRLLYNTLKHLKIIQIFYQVKYRLIKYKFNQIEVKINNVTPILHTKSISKGVIYTNNTFIILNITSEFKSWNNTQYGMLWAYNLNYMDWLLQPDMDFEEGAKWINRFIDDVDSNTIGLDPYPIALRGINWIKFISIHFNKLNAEQLKTWNNSLYSQYKLLEKKLEYHLLGNHLLEDAYSLYIASIYFQDEKLYAKSSKLLLRELKEQILNDGSHYEQSPMYHSILLDRLLDCYNISVHNIFFEGQKTINNSLKGYAGRMLGHLSRIVYNDQTIPLLNDSANGITSTPTDLFDYAKRLNIEWSNINLGDSGYRKFVNKHFESIVDIGNIKATYQPGHSHADTFNFELRIDDKPFIIDTGISTYEKNTRRQYERSTVAHNCVSIKGTNSSEVWGGFRVGRRAKVTILESTDSSVTASHDGFGQIGTHSRTFTLSNDWLEISDNISTNNSAISYLHFAPDVSILSYNNRKIVTDNATVNVENAELVEIIKGKVAFEYNNIVDVNIALIHFKISLKFKIRNRL